MRVAVVGATGNVGTSVLGALAGEERVGSVLGIARRLPDLSLPKVEWAAADVTRDDLAERLSGADVVVLLSWLIQPSRDLNKLWMANVEGTMRAARAAARAGAGAILYASSVGAYSPGPKDRRVDERWPTGGVAGSYYARQKAEVERRLNRFEAEHPRVRVVRMRPGLVFKREAAQGIRRLFGGPLFPGSLARPGLIKAVPEIPGLRGQVVHSYDVGEAFRLAAVREVRGAFNLAAEPPLDAAELAREFGARTFRVSARALRALVGASWRLRLHPVSPGWLDLALGVPLMDTGRARRELGWEPRRSSLEAVRDLMEGLRSGADLDTPPLSARSGGRLRGREFGTGVGGREP
ncbi:NAD-dependent epimerase/dehydratase [Rubrobacter xylanophilus DSM 9941]|uniref:NAD-dependent epimerase/dehydratase n=1 Tax=Rubrobacter xylanophilus (strain DSM 9941 / JCM 11954 / NBRC 16129 / PRD-1) TaxID=266117 RepID=Q1AY39_RUBXD|nr:NAD-dependent epimerase/dehydratase family protein [Rubrobacter xylanophilus]ABG03689.1 NAD-dependent epimerase/dehydratase [Rubrobacter xylanophilus DSM 9941]